MATRSKKEKTKQDKEYEKKKGKKGKEAKNIESESDTEKKKDIKRKFSSDEKKGKKNKKRKNVQNTEGEIRKEKLDICRQFVTAMAENQPDFNQIDQLLAQNSDVLIEAKKKNEDVAFFTELLQMHEREFGMVVTIVDDKL